MFAVKRQIEIKLPWGDCIRKLKIIPVTQHTTRITRMSSRGWRGTDLCPSRVSPSVRPDTRARERTCLSRPSALCQARGRAPGSQEEEVVHFITTVTLQSPVSGINAVQTGDPRKTARKWQSEDAAWAFPTPHRCHPELVEWQQDKQSNEEVGWRTYVPQQGVYRQSEVPMPRVVGSRAELEAHVATPHPEGFRVLGGLS